MAEGDLSFQTMIDSSDEIGSLDRSIKDSLYSISEVLRRVRDVSARISDTTETVGRESGKVVDGTMLEAEAIAEISSSIEELNAAIGEVADSTANLAQSVQDTAASIEETANTISSIKDITHEVSEGVDTTSTSIHEMSAAIKQIADHADDLGSVSEESLAAVDEIISSVREVEGSAKESAMLSQRVTDDASTLGVSAINETIAGMEKIKSSVSRTAEVIKRLGGRSDEIGSILTVIDDVTDQTTLLALNASILAAQAGEHGKGFSVVANEIKDLAERTALSTHEIDSLIRAVRDEVAEAVSTMNDGMESVDEGMGLSKKASSALGKILRSSQSSAEMSASIERATGEQVKTVGYVIGAIERVRDMVTEIIAATKEQAKSTSLIMDATEKIREASHRADSATEQQAEGSRQVSQSVEVISEMSQHILRAINEQKTGSKQIWASIEKIKDMPARNRDLAFKINKVLKELSRDSELANMEMQKFTLYEGADMDIVRFGIVPFDSPAELYKRFMPLIEYLRQETGLRFEIMVAPDYETAVRDMATGRAHLGFMTSYTYLQALEQADIRLLVQLLRDGKPFHRAVLITREHSTVRSLEDIANRSVAFVNEQSVSGYQVPLAMLKDAGVRIEDLSYHQPLGFHEDVIKAVLAGEFDVGAVMESTFDKHSEEGLRVLGASEYLPEFTICSSLALDDASAQTLVGALLKLKDGSPEAKSVLGSIDPHYTGLAETAEDNFTVIKKYITKAG
jgi:phosphate/phosphite/phosphonate ABC transporter binding protein